MVVFLEFDDEVGGQGALGDDGSEVRDFVSILVTNRFDRELCSKP